jgi:TPR repeat protein
MSSKRILKLLTTIIFSANLIALTNSVMAMNWEEADRLQDKISHGDKAAFNLLRKAANAGDLIAEKEMASLYSLGIGVKPSRDQYHFWTKKTAEQGDAEGEVAFSAICGDKNGKWDCSQDWLEKAADRGNLQGEINLANLYERKEDYINAAKWYLQCIKQVDNNPHLSDAMSSLGSFYLYGNGVPQDYEKALFLFKKSIDLGNTSVTIFLGPMYRDGIGVPQNNIVAFALFNIGLDSMDRDKLSYRMNQQDIELAQQLTKKMQSVGINKAIDAYFPH